MRIVIPGFGTARFERHGSRGGYGWCLRTVCFDVVVDGVAVRDCGGRPLQSHFEGFLILRDEAARRWAKCASTSSLDVSGRVSSNASCTIERNQASCSGFGVAACTVVVISTATG